MDPNLGSGVLNPDASVTDMNWRLPGPATNSGLGGGGKGGALLSGCSIRRKTRNSWNWRWWRWWCPNWTKNSCTSKYNNERSGHGGGGTVVVVRYKIGETGTEKATGGVISYYNNKTIHTFTSSGTFNITS